MRKRNLHVNEFLSITGEQQAMRERSIIVSGILLLLTVLLTSSLSAQDLTVNGSGDQGTVNLGTVEAGGSKDFTVATDKCEEITGKVTGGDDGWSGGGAGESITFTFNAEENDSGIHPGQFGGKVKGCPGGKGEGGGNNEWSVKANVCVGCQLGLTTNTKKPCPGDIIKLKAKLKDQCGSFLSGRKVTIDCGKISGKKKTNNNGFVSISFSTFALGDKLSTNCSAYTDLGGKKIACRDDIKIDLTSASVRDVFKEGGLNTRKKIDIPKLLNDLDQLDATDFPGTGRRGPLKNPIKAGLDKFRQITEDPVEELGKYAAEKALENTVGGTGKFPLNPLTVAKFANTIVSSAATESFKSIEKTGENQFELRGTGLTGIIESGGRKTEVSEIPYMNPETGRQERLRTTLGDVFKTAKYAAFVRNFIQDRKFCKRRKNKGN